MSLTLTQIDKALAQALSAIPEVSRIAWPNKSANPARPFVMFQHAPGQWNDRTISGGDTIASGVAVLTVVTDLDVYATSAIALADSVMAAFPKGRRIAVDGGCVTISAPPRPLTGFADGPDWRQPVEVSYVTETA